MSNNHWIKEPLWTVAEGFAEQNYEEGGDAIALTLYEKMEELFGDEARRNKFRSTMSLSQFNSFRIIREWWDCSIEEDPWFRANRDRLKALELLKQHSILDLGSPPVIQILFGIGPTIPKISTYRLIVHRLFLMEFDPNYEGQDLRLSGAVLQAERERASFHAAVQRLCFPFFPCLGLESNPSAVDRGEVEKRSSKPKLADILDDVLGSCIEACPWLESRRDRTKYPFYLWDLQKKRTVSVHELSQDPEYICISHTWGRWHDPAEEFAPIDNVPWLVPRNSRFNVQDLPEMLEAAFDVEYVWLDLLCIPQNRSELALLEISRQAAIFTMAKTVVAWLWDVRSWSGLSGITEWLAHFCIQNRGDVEEDLPDSPVCQETEMVSKDAPQDHPHTPIGWFTSLWTLQEACLRPDILLLNHDFEVFTVGGAPATLDSLAALFNFAIGQYPHSPYETLINRPRFTQDLEEGTYAELEQLNPIGCIRRRRALERAPENIGSFYEIYDVFLSSGTSRLYSISPTGLLYLGQHRQCTSRRAEAIMSAVGATDWFNTYVAEHHSAPEVDLIHGLYPCSFVNEVARKSGAVFYATVASDLSYLEGVVDASNGAWRPINPLLGIGSLLPFTMTRTILLPQERNSQSWYGHTSISSWHIESDGRVRMPQAGVVATCIAGLSGNDKAYGIEGTEPKIRAAIRIPGVFQTDPQQEVNLLEWVRSFWDSSTFPNYAISVYQQTKKVHWGLILKSVGKEGVLVKIGTFLTGSISAAGVPTN
ncbi:hypothetical protein H2200_008270 [Cladophialophora chaetospira]|uniref:Heterokaryon incompatibility domain-containing protein n=1 Tax=Cladophialophora chaetospira TaxID=386627 RepID=A0AA38X5G6_9EURO|nr:hypothetical protein H2200_008270 [Cladophialophora chaetospira]